MSKTVSLSSGGKVSQSSWYELLFENEGLRDNAPGLGGTEESASLGTASGSCSRASGVGLSKGSSEAKDPSTAGSDLLRWGIPGSSMRSFCWKENIVGPSRL